MTGWLGFAWLLFLLAAGGWLLAVALVPLLTKVLSVYHPPITLRRRVWMLASLSWLLPLVMIAGVAILASAKKVGWLHDHCLHHTPHHPHFCFEHLPQLLLGYPHLLVMFMAAALFAALMGTLIWREYQHAGTTRSLTALSGGKRRVRILNISQASAFVAGLIKPHIFLSRGILRHFDYRQRRIIVSHEVAHIRHHDLWRNLFFEITLLLHLPKTARVLRQHWRHAMESQADDRVAARYGATEVAATLLTLTKMRLPSSQPVSISGADPAGRIKRLLRVQSAPAKIFEWCYWPLLIGLGVLLVASHHSLETFLGFFVAT